jgi:hypothetical protein
LLAGVMRKVRLGVVVGSAASLALGATAAGTAAQSASTRPLASLLRSPLVTLGRAPLAPRGARYAGPLAKGRQMTLGIAFAPRDAAALRSYATLVSAPGSTEFGHFITPTKFRATFGPTSQAISDVERVLRAEGFNVSAPSRNGLIMQVRARVSVVETAFHVTLNGYRLADGTDGWAASEAPSLQQSIAPDVTAILGLDELIGPHSFLKRPRLTVRSAPPGVAKPAPAASNGGPVPCSAASAGASNYGGYTFDKLAAAYGVEGLYNAGDLGQNETVALFELEPFLTSDISTFDTCYFGATKAQAMLGRLSVRKVDGGIPAGSGEGESVLDVEDISALAPQAHIEVYEAPGSNIGMEYATNDIYNAMVNDDTANIISASWGLCEQALESAAPGAQEVENTIFEEAAAQGQSAFAAAGDSGSNDCAFGATATSPPVEVDDPASQPFVLGVGGTTLLKAAQPPTETVWNDGGGGGGGGGGISSTWASAGWQGQSGVAGVSNSYTKSSAYAFCVPAAGALRPASLPTASLATPPCREVPDVTIEGDENTGTSFYQRNGGGWGTIGGTSTSAPMWAAITADIAASTGCDSLAVNATNHERDLGFVAPALYEAAATSAAGHDFNDITVGTNDIFNLKKGYPATAGYDLASGLGSPVVTDASAGAGSLVAQTGLSASLCELLSPSSATVAVTGLTPAAGPVAGGNAIVVKGKGFSGSGVSVKAVTFGSAQATSFTVETSGTISVKVPPARPVPGTGGETSFTPGPVDVTVTVSTSAGVTTSRPTASTDRYIYVASSGKSLLPSVSGVGPSGGATAGGNTVDIYGSGFGSEGPVSAVTFGTVAATHLKYLTNYEIQVTVPAEGKATVCAGGKGFDAASACQVQVVVTGAHGPSPTWTILPAMTGSMKANDEGIVVPAPGTETDPAPSEYDYAPVPVIKSISPNPYTDAGPKPITIKGSGFNILTLNWVNVGAADKWADNDSSYSSVTATSITLVPYLPSPGSGTKTVEITVLSLGGLSAAAKLSYHA